MIAKIHVENEGEKDMERFHVVVENGPGRTIITCSTYFAAMVIQDAFSGVTDIRHERG